MDTHPVRDRYNGGVVRTEDVGEAASRMGPSTELERLTQFEKINGQTNIARTLSLAQLLDLVAVGSGSADTKAYIFIVQLEESKVALVATG
jgi:hypothetical protein